MSGKDIAAAFIAAALAELEALKPGNVHVHAGGHGMTVADFEKSAEAAAPHIAKVGAGVGARILAAVEATQAAVGQNTNLGIVLLAAPIATAAEQAGRGELRAALRAVLAGLTREDAELAFRAIALANPGGLGTRADHDVRAPAQVTLIEAMHLAAPRDRIARQYTTAYADIFEIGLPAARDTGSLAEAAAKVYWRFLTTTPDSHIARKYGAAKAKAVRRLAQEVDRSLKTTTDARDRTLQLIKLDARLKAEGANPGTSADLTVATVFTRILLVARA
jgi:triphosphoribosyl-dephospho-CoA synthase